MRISREQRAKSLIDFDSSYSNGDIIAGIDEVGRGPLAGCVMAACVVLPKGYFNIWIDDSKKLSEKRRKSVYDDIIKNAVFIGLGRCEPEEIDELNILNATKLAMQKALVDCPSKVLLVDAVKGLQFPGVQIPIIHGDAISYHIGAASIVAKVTRDTEMQMLHEIYPAYGFLSNKGYGTKEHIETIKKYGPCKIHRESFIKNFV